MKAIKLIPILALLLMAFGSIGEANTRRLILPMGDRVYSTTGSFFQDTIYLKQEIRNRYPGLSLFLNRAELEDVFLTAKSAMGLGTASLRIGNWEGMPYRIEGNPRDFFNNAAYTFDRIDFRVPWRITPNSVWQIKFKGTVKVRNVVVIIDTNTIPFPTPIPRPIPRPRPRPPGPIH